KQMLSQRVKPISKKVDNATSRSTIHPEMTVFSGLAHRIINNYFIPKMAAVLAEGIMHWVVLVDIMRFLVGEDGDQASAIAAIDNRAVGVGGLAPGYKLSALDRAQR